MPPITGSISCPRPSATSSNISIKAIAPIAATPGGLSRRYTVAVCGERLPFEKRADARLQWTRDWRHADFFIAPTHMNCDRALDGKVVATVERLGVLIGVVKDRRTLIGPKVAHNGGNQIAVTHAARARYL